MPVVQAEAILISIHIAMVITMPVMLLLLLLLLQILLLILKLPHLLLCPCYLLLDLNSLAHILFMGLSVRLIGGGRRVVMDVSMDIDRMWVEFVHVLLCFALHLLLLLLLLVLLLLEALLLFDLPFPLFLLELIRGMVQLILIIGGCVIVVDMVWNTRGSRVLVDDRGVVVDVDGLWSSVRVGVGQHWLCSVVGSSMRSIDVVRVRVIVRVVVISNVCMRVHDVSHFSRGWRPLIVLWHNDPWSVSVLPSIAFLTPSMLGLNSDHHACRCKKSLHHF